MALVEDAAALALLKDGPLEHDLWESQAEDSTLKSRDGGSGVRQLPGNLPCRVEGFYFVYCAHVQSAFTYKKSNPAPWLSLLLPSSRLKSSLEIVAIANSSARIVDAGQESIVRIISRSPSALLCRATAWHLSPKLLQSAGGAISILGH